MKNYNKTLIGSVLAFVIGASCCWLSALGVWVGGASVVAVLVNWIENWQLVVLILSAILVLVSLYLKYKK